MPIVYHNPHTVVSPQKFIRKVTVLYDGGKDGFSLAVLDWEGTDHIGIRWNVAMKERKDEDKQTGKVLCDGAPSSKGIPSWFILPVELFSPELFDHNSTAFMNLITKWKQSKRK